MFGYSKVHFIGIGGIGMSALAKMLVNMGVEVTGSDIADSKNTAELKDMGVRVFIGHRRENLGEVDLVVYSSAVKEDNPEIVEAKRRGIKIVKRGELLAWICQSKKTFAVAGSHGKTTTTAMLAKVFMEAGFSPTVMVGGKMRDFNNSNCIVGDGDIFIAETDESDGSFLLFEPFLAVVTNIDREHVGYYGSYDGLKAAFREFLEKIKKYRVVCLDSKDLVEVADGLDKITYSLTDIKADVAVLDIVFERLSSYFTVATPWGKLDVKLNVPGMHNVQNALGVIAASLVYGVEPEVVARALEGFEGVERRLTIRGERKNVVVIDDYAHHPSEIEATLNAIRLGWPGRNIVAVFQPHRYSRLKDLWFDFAGAFKNADEVWVTSIYSAGETGNSLDPRVLAKNIASASAKRVFYVDNYEDIAFALSRRLSEDVVVTLGAGDIWKLCERLLDLMD